MLVHDAFTFASRGVWAGDLPKVIRKDLKERTPESEEEIERYNRFAGGRAHLVAKSLFCAGTTWPGVLAVRTGVRWTTFVHGPTPTRSGWAAADSRGEARGPSI